MDGTVFLGSIILHTIRRKREQGSSSMGIEYYNSLEEMTPGVYAGLFREPQDPGYPFQSLIEEGAYPTVQRNPTRLCSSDPAKLEIDLISVRSS